MDLSLSPSGSTERESPTAMQSARESLHQCWSPCDAMRCDEWYGMLVWCDLTNLLLCATAGGVPSRAVGVVDRERERGVGRLAVDWWLL